MRNKESYYNKSKAIREQETTIPLVGEFSNALILFLFKNNAGLLLSLLSSFTNAPLAPTDNVNRSSFNFNITNQSAIANFLQSFTILAQSAKQTNSSYLIDHQQRQQRIIHATPDSNNFIEITQNESNNELTIQTHSEKKTLTLYDLDDSDLDEDIFGQ